jgi:hypothetical protein
MLSKCANPSCSAAFLRLNEGKLFRVDNNSPNGERQNGQKFQQKMEHFWLCVDCARDFTLAVHNGEIVVIPISQVFPRAS